jgi:spermidine synthase
MKSSNNRTIILLFFSVFVIATCGLIYELLAGTVASYLMGDSVKQFSFIIGIYLSSMGLGSFLSKYLKDKWLERFIEIEILIGLIGGSSSILLFWLFSITPYFSFFLYGLVSIIGVLVGLEIPLLMNILRDKVTFTDLVSNIFTFDYIGALFASILFPLVFIPWLGIFDTSILTGIVNILVALYLMYFFRNQILNKVWLKIKAIVVLIILLILLYFSKSILNTTEEMLYNENIIFSSTSSYQRFCITRIQNTFKLYLNNNLQFSTKDEYRYHEALVHPILSLSPKIENVLVLGGGDGMATREILKYADVKQITVVDLDPALTNFFKNNILFKKIKCQCF